MSFVAEPGRLDRVVARHLGVHRADVQRAITDGRILVNGAQKPKSFLLVGGEAISGEIPGRGVLQPEEGGVPVLYQDDWLMVVSKPAGLPTHPTVSLRTGTLVNRLLGMGVALSTAGEEDRPGIVHRLDAGTSGIMIVAKDDRAHRALSEMFQRHEIDRRYLALVRARIRYQACDQRGLADPGRAREAHNRRLARLRIDLAHERPALGIVVLHQRDRPRQRTLVAGEQRLGQLGGCARLRHGG